MNQISSNIIDEYSKEGVETNKVKTEEEVKELFGDHYH